MVSINFLMDQRGVGMKKIVWISLSLIIVGLGVYGVVFYCNTIQGAWPAFTGAPVDIASIIPSCTEHEIENTNNCPLDFPEDFSISLFADGVEEARVILIGPRGNMWVSRTDDGAIMRLDIAEGKVSHKEDVFTDLEDPHGIVLDPQDPFIMYIAEETALSKVRLYSEEGLQKIMDLPEGDRHTTRSLLFGEDGRLYISIGSRCDVCVEEDDDRVATVYVMNKDGSNFQLFSDGLRNAVFMTLHPVSGNIWVTEMGRDFLGDNLPPDEINILSQGEHYGWPYCYGKQVHDSDFDPDESHLSFCETTVPSYINLQAHSAPLGLDFIPEEGWPEDYWYDLIVAYHGSWNRSIPTGYKLVRFALDAQGQPEGQSFQAIDFITGWLTEDNESLGRPVDVLIQPGGLMYISDDKAGVIYKVIYVGE